MLRYSYLFHYLDLFYHIISVLVAYLIIIFYLYSITDFSIVIFSQLLAILLPWRIILKIKLHYVKWQNNAWPLEDTKLIIFYVLVMC